MCYKNYPNTEVQTGFVFICPGKFEEQKGKPCAGQTGAVMEVGLRSLQRLEPKIFPFTDRYQYHITNAWPKVEYPAMTGRSVPHKAEVCDESNLLRLHSEIINLRYVIVCGQKAHEAVRSCISKYGHDGRIAYVRHTSRRALGCPTNENLPKVMQQWAGDIVSQIAL